MGKRIDCECGFVLKAESDEELVDRCQAHVQEAHPSSSASSAATTCSRWRSRTTEAGYGRHPVPRRDQSYRGCVARWR